MKKVVRLRESDITRIVRRVLSEQNYSESQLVTSFDGTLERPLSLEVFDKTGKAVKNVQVYKVFNDQGKYFAVYKGPKTGKDVYRYFITCDSLELHDAIDKQTYKNDQFVLAMRKRFCGSFKR